MWLFSLAVLVLIRWNGRLFEFVSLSRGKFMLTYDDTPELDASLNMDTKFASLSKWRWEKN
jgi:hypothetical protein